MNFIRKFASLKLTLVGMGLMVIASIAIYGDPTGIPMWVIVAPLALLAINLSAAILTNQRINQQPGLLVFHVSLLSLVILAGVGRLTHMDAHLEIITGGKFSADNLIEVTAGPLHQGALDSVVFRQGIYTVVYEAGMRRGLTHSYVQVQQGNQWIDKVVGDDRPLIINGYRFYTTFNKGFSPILTWTPEGGSPVTGTINMPSYPLFEYKQDNSWTPPNGEPIRFWLRLDTGMKEDDSWILDGRNASGVLVTKVDGERKELTIGQSVKLPGGELRYEALSTWMGYRLFYDPTIQWMFFVAIAGVAGLVHYFWQKLNLVSWRDAEAPSPATDMTDSPLEHGKMSVNRETMVHKTKVHDSVVQGESSI